MAGEGRKGLTLLDKSQPAILISSIIVGLLIAEYSPSLAASLEWLIPFGMFIIVYNIFTSVELRELLLALRNVKSTLTVLAVNFAITPVYAWFLGYFFLRSYPDIWVGLVLYLVAPCMGWFLIFTSLAGGNVPLGVTLLAWNTLLMLALMPFYMYILVGKIIIIDFSQILGSIMMFLVLPFLFGRLTQRFIVEMKGHTYFNKTVKPFLSLANLVILAAVVVAIFASQGNLLFENPFVIMRLIPPVLIFFFSILLLDLILGKLLKLSYGDIALIVFTTTARNSEVALAIAVSAFPANPLVPLAIAIGPSIELPVLTILLQILLWVRKHWDLKLFPPT